MPATQILSTRLFIPTPLPQAVARPRLIARLNAGRQRRLTLLSAPAGSGKTSLLAEWLGRNPPCPVAWLSLEENDADPARFLTYLVAALQKSGDSEKPKTPVGSVLLPLLQAPQPPPLENLLSTLLNDIGALANERILVLDDYHRIDSSAVDAIIAFLLEHQAPNLHLVIATREDPRLPLARLRARGWLSELRAADLRFSPAEAADFLNHNMGLKLSPLNIAMLEARTEGWVAGIQLAALSLQGVNDPSVFIQSFSGSHRFVLDYLLEEVLEQQPPEVQTFLLHTSILERFCAPLCEALLPESTRSGQEALLYLERSNLFLVPLDDERRWYRYHHLFADLLRQRLSQQLAANGQDKEKFLNELHLRASRWFEENNLEVEAFLHAAAAHDFERTQRLLNGKGLPLHFRGALLPVLNWLKSLPVETLNAHPALWVTFASVLSMSGKTVETEEKLQAAEAALQGAEDNVVTRNLIGHIAAIRALLAAVAYQADVVISQSQRALEYLAPGNLAVRTATIWKLGWAYQLRGERAAAMRAYEEAVSISEKSGNTIILVSAATGLGNMQEMDIQLHQADATYHKVVQLAGDLPTPITCETYLGLARIAYEWNDLSSARSFYERSIQIARQIDYSDRQIVAEIFHARLELANGDLDSAALILEQSAAAARQQNHTNLIPEIDVLRVLVLQRRGLLPEALSLANASAPPLYRAYLHLALAEAPAALLILQACKNDMQNKDWKDDYLKSLILLALAYRLNNEKEPALQTLTEALALAQPAGMLRCFIDEGQPMAELLSGALKAGILPDYVSVLLAAFKAEPLSAAYPPATSQVLVEPLTPRELEVLQLIALGLSNDEICARLFLALSTVKGYNRQIFDKLQVQRRTEAVARARGLGLIP